MSNSNNLQFDYQESLQQYRLLADIRFKLLAFVPTISALAVALLTESGVSPETRLAVGLLGFTMTLGIIFYELRNSEFYGATMQRLKCLERQLELTICDKDQTKGGLFNERPRRELKMFGLVTIWHNRGLALVYGAAIGGWTYIIFDGLFSATGHPQPLASLMIAFVFSWAAIWEFLHLGNPDGTQSAAEADSRASGADQ